MICVALSRVNCVDLRPVRTAVIRVIRVPLNPGGPSVIRVSLNRGDPRVIRVSLNPGDPRVIRVSLSRAIRVDLHPR